MEEITFSITETAATRLLELLKEFEQQFSIHVHFENIPSLDGWSRVVEKAIYHNGPDVSVVGNSWVGDLVQMDALRPFGTKDVQEITGGKHYFEAVWKNSLWIDQGTRVVFSIPWLADSRVVFYRRSLLERAGVDETTAFIDTKHFEKTLATLLDNGVDIPLALTTQRSNLTIHYLASWVWGAGCDFLERKGEATDLAFDRPDTLAACKGFFRLARYLGNGGRLLDEQQSYEAFASGKAAVTLGGSWILSTVSPEIRQDLGVVRMPGVSFVGGDDLVIWKHSRHEHAALLLIQFLHGEGAVKLLCPENGLPISEIDWSRPPLDSKAYQVFKTSIQEGRGFPNIRLWGLVEKRLTDAFPKIWKDILQNPDSSTDEIVGTQLTNLAKRLRLALDN